MKYNRTPFFLLVFIDGQLSVRSPLAFFWSGNAEPDPVEVAKRFNVCYDETFDHVDVLPFAPNALDLSE